MTHATLITTRLCLHRERQCGAGKKRPGTAKRLPGPRFTAATTALQTVDPPRGQPGFSVRHHDALAISHRRYIRETWCRAGSTPEDPVLGDRLRARRRGSRMRGGRSLDRARIHLSRRDRHTLSSGRGFSGRSAAHQAEGTDRGEKEFVEAFHRYIARLQKEAS